MAGNPQARRIGDDAIGFFIEAFAPFAEDRLLRAYGPTWRRDRGFESGTTLGRGRSLTDVAELLGLLKEGPEYLKAFARSTSLAPMAMFELARGARDRRNLLYHRTRPWEASDAIQLLDRLGQVLAAFGLQGPPTSDQFAELEIECAAVIAGDTSGQLADLRIAHLESLLAQTTYVDLAGISPRAGTKIVQVRLDDVYVEPRLQLQKPDEEGAEDLSLVDVLLLRRVIIKAGPGAGKSTLVRRMVRVLALHLDDRVAVSTPIVVSASAFAETVVLEPELSLRRYIARRLGDRFGALFSADLETGRAIVFVDGLDEIADEPLRSKASRLIGEFAADYGDVSLIVTSRPTGFRAPAGWSDFRTLTLAPFDSDEVEAFVRGWAARLDEHEPGMDADQLLKDISASESVRDLASTPLLLTILVLLWRRGIRLPTRRHELYDVATLTMLQDWPSRRLGARFDERRMLRLLQPIAHNLIAAGATTVPESDVLAAWSRAMSELEPELEPRAAREEALGALRMVQEHTGFFVEAGFDHGERHYAFLHRSFAEYLAALHLAEGWDAGNLDLSDFAVAHRWKEVFRLFAAHLGERGPSAASALAEALLGMAAPFERWLHRGLRILLSLMAEGLELRPDVRDRVTAAAITDYLDPDREPFRHPLARQLCAVARVQPLGRSVDGLLERAEDDPQRAARKAWLRVLLAPMSTARLADALAHLDSLAAVSIDPDLDVETLGSALVDYGDGPEQALEDRPCPVILCANELFAPDPETVDRLRAAGVPLYSAAEVAAEPAISENARGIWMLDTATVGDLTPRELVDLDAAEGNAWLPPLLWQDPSWHLAMATGIGALVAEGELTPPVANLALLCAHHFAPETDGGMAWLKLLVDLASDGPSATREVALVRLLTSQFAEATSSEDLDDRIATLLRSDDLAVRRAIPIAMAMQGEGFDGRLELRAREFVVADPDPVVRGLARRALIVCQLTDEPLGMLASPEIAVPDEALPDEWGLDHTQPLVHYLMTLPDSIDARRGMAQVLEAVLLVAPHDQNELAFDYTTTNPEVEAVARRLAFAGRPETRAWAGLLLGALDREPARDELAVLFADGDPRVRAAAIAGIVPADLEDVGWLLDTMPAFFACDHGTLTEHFAAAIVAHATEDVKRDLLAIVEATIDAEPGNWGALTLLSALTGEE